MSTNASSKNNRILIAGGFSTDERINTIKECIADGVRICGIIASRRSIDLSKYDLGLPLFFYDELEIINNDSCINDTGISSELIIKYEEILQRIISDARTAYLYERIYGFKFGSSYFNHFVQIETICWNSILTIMRLKPDRIVYMSVTHNLRSWIFCKCAELFDIPTYFSVKTPLMWRYWPVRGLDKQKTVCLDNQVCKLHSDVKLSSKTDVILKKYRSCYEDGIPSYMSRKINKYGGSSWSWKREILRILTPRPIKLINNILEIINKYKLFKTYSILAQDLTEDEKYFVFFLHYQPEATTIPLGLKYCQQWLAIKDIAASLPDNYFLLVKEHPAMLTSSFSKEFRNKYFYEAISKLPRVNLTPLNHNPFILIDKSEGVCTLTGTVGFEALCRGKQALVFGAASYRDAPGVYFVNSRIQVKKALSDIISKKNSISNESLEGYLKWVEKYSIEGEVDFKTDDLYDVEYRNDASKKVWESLIRMQDEPVNVIYNKER